MADDMTKAAKVLNHPAVVEDVDALLEASVALSSRSERLRKTPYTLRQRATLYGIVNPLKKDVNKVRDELAKAIKGEIEASCEVGTGGKLTLEEDHEGLLSQNDKGNIFLRDGNTVLDLRPVAKEVFVEEAAREILGAKNQLAHCVEDVVTVKDPHLLMNAISNALEALHAAGGGEAAQALNDAVFAAVEIGGRISQERIQELVQEGRLSVDDLVPMFQTTYSYSLYDK
jgi:hypothetical protein